MPRIQRSPQGQGPPLAALSPLRTIREGAGSKPPRRSGSDVPIEIRHRRRRRWRNTFAVLLGLMMAPLFYEASTLSVARWRSMTGPSVTVRTPVLDTVQSASNELTRLGSRTIRSKFNNLPWRPTYVLAFGAVWVFMGWMWLRRL